MKRFVEILITAMITLAWTGLGYSQESILVEREDFFPEGIEYDAAEDRFLLGSLSEGTIFAVKDDGAYQAFIEDDDLISTVGIEIDEKRNRLLVANVSNPDVYMDNTQKTQIYLGIYDLTTGERLQMVDLISGGPEGSHVANDITVDSEGNAYVTDSRASTIYKVDLNGNASVFVESDQFDGPNGIVYHPDGYLLVANAGGGFLSKVPLDNPEGLTRVELEQVIQGADGMVLHPNNNLVVAGRKAQTIFSLSSDDDWASATIEATAADHPASTVALRGDQVYAIYPQLDKYFSGESVKAFEIVHVKFCD